MSPLLLFLLNKMFKIRIDFINVNNKKKKKKHVMSKRQKTRNKHPKI